MKRLRTVVPMLLLALGGTPLDAPRLLGAEPAGSLSISPGAERPAEPVQTILLTDRLRTWLEMPRPPYEVAVAVKMKLEQAGFRVTHDPEEAHHAVVRIVYEEQPGRTYRFLEQGTRITCIVALRPARPNDQPWMTISLRAETGWPQPVRSLYWDAVQRLEENPYYYFLGELLAGWLRHEAGPAETFAKVLREPPLTISTEGESSSLTARQAANELARLGAIEELGRLGKARALETLWHLAERSSRQERRGAVAAIGALGDPSAIERLRRLRETATDPTLRAAIDASLAQLQQRG